MPICKECNKSFPNRMVIDGKLRTLNSRKYCLECSPFGEHNTKKLNKELIYKCSKCGETDPSKFYGKKRYTCGKCHNKITIERGNDNKYKIIEYMGGKCSICGYNKCSNALDLHHIDPSKKDRNFKCKRGWGWERIEKELENCILVCRNCHAEIHYSE